VPSEPGGAADGAVKNFVDFALVQGLAPGLTYGDVAQSKTRAELGISSLNMIILIANYVEEKTGGSLSLEPEWVPLLDEVEGILSVISEIDRSSLTEHAS
jgi:hypothetical protein